MWKKHLLCVACAIVLIGLVAVQPAAAAAGDPFASVNAAPVGDIDVETDVSIDGGTTWLDADAATGPMLLASGAAPQFRFNVTNIGDSNLNGVALTDTVLGTITLPSTTLQKDTSTVVVRTGTWAAGQYTGTATATGRKGSVDHTDSDAVNYFGAAPAIDVETDVSIDGGATWEDADAPPGPTLLQGGPAPQFRFAVTNAGNVPLSNVDVTDDVSGAISLDGTLAVGASAEYILAAAWVAGQHTNTGTASGSFTDGAGTTGSSSDTDAANYVGTVPPAPSISIEAQTNGQDADTPPGPSIPVGAPVQWTYIVTNTGNVALTNVAVTDNRGVAVTAPRTVLAPGESMTATASGTAAAGQYGNIGTVAGTPPAGPVVTASDPSHYFGIGSARIDFETDVSADDGATWHDADAPPGPDVTAGTAPKFRFTTTNTGDVPLTMVNAYGHLGPIAQLDPGASFEAVEERAWAPGQQLFGSSASGTYSGQTVADSDGAWYYGAVPGIDIEAQTNGEDADAPPGPSVPVGSTVTWTYVVTNTGNVPLSGVTLVDDSGSPTNPADDFAPTFVGGDTNGNGLLDMGETWSYTASSIAAFGQWASTATVTGTPSTGPTVTASDPSHYYGLSPPVASFTANVTSGLVPLAVQFTNTSTGEGITGVSWDFENDGTPDSTEQNPVHVFTAARSYTVNLTVTNAAGSASATRIVSVGSRPWIAANFETNVTTGAAPLTVQFTDTSTGAVYYWGWECGDGATSTERSPVHTFAAPGTYTVRLLISNYMTTDIQQRTVTVTETPPTPLVANFTANATSGIAPMTVRFTDTSTGDGIDGRWWYFGDGGSSTEQDPVHVYTVPGTYTVTLVVTNAGGLDSEVKTRYISVMPDMPPIGGDKGYFLVSTEPAGAAISIEDISGTRYPRGNTTNGPLNVSVYLTATPMRKIIANLSGYRDAAWNIGQYPQKGQTVPVLLTLEPIATPTPTPGSGGPYPGPHSPGTVIQAEDFDAGGEGVAYHDIEPANLGGRYRLAEGVDIEVVDGVTDVGWIRAGEYLTYSVDAAAAGSFTLTLRAANPDATAKPVTVYLDEVPAGQVLIGGTGAWTSYSDFAGSAPISVPAGRHVVTLAFEGTDRVNLDWLRLGAGAAPTVTTTTTDAPPSGAANLLAAPTTAPMGATVKFTVTPAAGKSIKAVWWSFDAPAHLNTWNSRAVNPTFFYPRTGTFSPYVKLTYTDGTTEEVHRVDYVRAT